MKHIANYIVTIASIAASLLVLSSCGGGGGSTTSTTPVITADQNLFQKSSVAPSISIYGFGDSSFVSNAETVSITGAVASPSRKILALTGTIGGVDVGAISVDSQGMYGFSTKLKSGENTLILKAQEQNGLVATKQIVLSYVQDSTISKDFSIDTHSIGDGQSKSITAIIAFSSTTGIKSVDVILYPSGTTIISMKDDGVLPDEIKADGVYTSKYTYTASSTANKCFRAKITPIAGLAYYSGVSCFDLYTAKTNVDYELSSAASDLIISKYNATSSLNLTRLERAKKVVDEIKANEQFGVYFTSIHYDDKGNIFWVLKSGLPGSFLVNTSNTKAIGNIQSNSFYYVSPHDSGTGTGFGNKYSYSFKSLRDSDAFSEIAPSLNIRDVNVFKTFYNAGIVHLATHGGQSSNRTILSTGLVLPKIVCKETIVEKLWQDFGVMVTPKYCDDTTSIREYTDNCAFLGIWNCMAEVGTLEDGTRVVLVFARYFEEFLKDNFNGSLIFIDACESFDSTDLRDIFFRKGAAGFMGWRNSILISYTRDFSKTFYENFSNGKSVTEAIAAAKVAWGNTDGQKSTAGEIDVIFRSGVSDLRSADLSLKNGDFESGSISPWQQNGDARVISKLAEFNPVDGKFMGIISTGLGYTTTSGSISQKTFVNSTLTNLRFSWNFLSEEFKEFCGSTFQDYFKVSACKSDGTCDTLFTKRIDDLCGSVTASTAVFDKGGVYATGWLSQSINISSYRGKAITLKFEVSDIGDSVYDTAVLLDSIKLE